MQAKRLRALNHPSNTLRRRSALPAALVAMALAAIAAPAMAQVSQINATNTICGGDLQNYGNCTAGEISIAEVINVVWSGGITECVAGETITIQTATVNYSLNTNKRNDLILWLGEQAGTDPRAPADIGNGVSCSAHSVPGPFANPPTIQNPFGDVDGDQCGDVGISVSQASRIFTNIPIGCQDNNADGKVDVQALLTWSQNAQQACGTGPGQSFPTVGAPSKCDYQALDTVLDIVYPPILTLAKTVTNDNGGTALPGDFTLIATGPETISGTTGSAAVTNVPVDAGAYTLSETGPAGYAVTWTCTGGTGVQDGTSLTLSNSANPDPAARTTTCTAANDDIPATLTLVKDLTNNNGGDAVVNDWVLTADGTVDYAFTTSGWSGGRTVNPGTYALTESGPGGYTPGSWQCTGTTPTGNSITLSPGDNATCTITNDDIAPTLTLVKSVVGDGPLGSGDFTMHVTGEAGGCGQDGTANYVDTGAGVSVTPVESNCEYIITEDPVENYTLTSISCGAAGYPLTMDEGAVVTCTVTNTYTPPGSIALTKQVTNDNGGTLEPANFPLQLTAVGEGCSAPVGDVFSGYVLTDPTPGCEYTVGETQQTGYSLGSIVCQEAEGASADATFIFGQGDSWTCTVSNDDLPVNLTLVKEVTNDNGGTAGVDDWTLRATNGTDVLSGNTTVYWVGGIEIDAGDWTLSEIDGPDGYTASDWTCEDDSEVPAPIPVVDGTVSLELGDTAICTIVNDDDAATLTLVKDLTNDDGGTGVEADFTIVLTGDDSALPGSDDHSGGLGYEGSDTGVQPTVFAGVEYEVTEPALPPNYELTGIACVDDDTTGPVAQPFTLALGQNVTCTVSNDDTPPTLTLVKNVINDDGGQRLPGEFNLRLTGTDGVHDTGINYNDGDTPAIGGEVAYTVSETPPDDYELVGIVCQDVTGAPVGVDGSFTAVSGDDITCTVTNDDILQNAFFVVTKDFTDDNPANVTVQISCNTGLPLEQDFDISEDNEVRFVVRSFEPGAMDCRIQEIGGGTEGYTTTYFADLGEDGDAVEVRSEPEGCFYDAVFSGTFICDLTNTLDPVEVVVTKEWMIGSEVVPVELSAGASYTCYNVWLDPETQGKIVGNLDFDGAVDTDTIVDILPDFDGSSYCVISETLVGSEVEVDESGCARVPVAPGQGGACTITNTVFFEGIPTLNQYGLLLLVLLTMGVGLVAVRRFV